MAKPTTVYQRRPLSPVVSWCERIYSSCTAWRNIRHCFPDGRAFWKPLVSHLLNANPQPPPPPYARFIAPVSVDRGFYCRRGGRIPITASRAHHGKTRREGKRVLSPVPSLFGDCAWVFLGPERASWWHLSWGAGGSQMCDDFRALEVYSSILHAYSKTPARSLQTSLRD